MCLRNSTILSNPEKSKLLLGFRKLLSSMTLLGLLSATHTGCAQEGDVKGEDKEEVETIATEYSRQHSALVDELRKKGISSEVVLSAIEKVPRHIFVPESIRDSSYEDEALPIGLKQTISQPYVVAYMTEALELKPTDKVLEVGTGSGYQAAVLSYLVERVYSVELLAPLSERARSTLRSLEIDNVSFKTGDGYKGWAKYAPYDAIIVTASPTEIPQALVQQLKDGGRMIVPVGLRDVQWLLLISKNGGAISEKKLIPVRFVPMVHGAELN